MVTFYAIPDPGLYYVDIPAVRSLSAAEHVGAWGDRVVWGGMRHSQRVATLSCPYEDVMQIIST
ncbi:MAG: hypothetical protein ACRELF_06645 [Gemmataceae bacterium]